MEHIHKAIAAICFTRRILCFVLSCKTSPTVHQGHTRCFSSAFRRFYMNTCKMRAVCNVCGLQWQQCNVSKIVLWLPRRVPLSVHVGLKKVNHDQILGALPDRLDPIRDGGRPLLEVIITRQWGVGGTGLKFKFNDGLQQRTPHLLYRRQCGVKQGHSSSCWTGGGGGMLPFPPQCKWRCACVTPL